MNIVTVSTTVKFHELPSGTVVHNYQPGTQTDGSVRSVSWSKDGNWLAIVPHSGHAEIVSVKDRLKLIHTIQDIEEPSCASFQTTTKKNLAIGTKNGLILVYDIKSKSVKKRYPRTTSSVNHVHFTHKDGHVIAASASGDIYIYNFNNNTLSATFKVPSSNSVSALRVCPIKRNFLVAGSDAGVVAVWDINANKHKFFVNSHKAPVTSAVFSPINSDLVLSTGLDRQFCFYDVGHNQCIKNVSVDNNITAADFSPDGKFIAMASQKGNVHIYDTRNVQEAMYTFGAHTGAIKHALFRKGDDLLDLSVSSAIFEPAVKESECTGTINKQQLQDQSFDIYVQSPTPHQISQQSSATGCTEAAGDSFMAEMGLNKTDTPDSGKSISAASSAVFKRSESLKKYLDRTTPTPQSRSVQDKNGVSSSTPNFLKPNASPVLSPIVTSHSAHNASSSVITTESKTGINMPVPADLEALREEFKTELKFQSTHILFQTRQMFLDLLMYMVKHGVKMENSLNSLRSELNVEPTAQEPAPSVLEENLLLKQRLALMEEELAMLKADRANQND